MGVVVQPIGGMSDALLGMTPTVFALLMATFAIEAALAQESPVPPVDGSVPEVVVPPGPGEPRKESDRTIEVAVGQQLSDDSRVRAMEIKAAVRDGVVTLTGSAKDVEEKDAAEAVVRRVSGVRQVENRLVVQDEGEPAPGASKIPEIPAPR